MSSTTSKLKMESKTASTSQLVFPKELIPEIDPFIGEETTSYWLGKENIHTTIARLNKIFEDMKNEEIDDPAGFEAIQKTIERLQEISDQIKIEEKEKTKIKWKAEQVKEEEMEEEEYGEEQMELFPYGAGEYGEEMVREKPEKIDILRKMVEDFYYGDEWAEYMVNLIIKPSYEAPTDIETIKRKIENLEKLVVPSPKESVCWGESGESDLASDEFYKFHEEESLPPESCDIHYEEVEGEEDEKDARDINDADLIDPKELERMINEETPQTYKHIKIVLPTKIESLMLADDDDFNTILHEEELERMERLKKCMANDLNTSVPGYFYSRKHLLEIDEPIKNRPSRERNSYELRCKKFDKDDFEGLDPYAVSCDMLYKKAPFSFDSPSAGSKSDEKVKSEFGEVEEGFETLEKQSRVEDISVGTLGNSSSDFTEATFEFSKEKLNTDIQTRLKPYKILSENCTIPGNMILIHQVYGYDSTQFYNFHPVNNECFAYHSGKFIQVVNTRYGTMGSRATATGGAIGCMTTFPERSLIITGENGENSYITFYRWPSYEILSIVPNIETMGKFTNVSISPDAKFFCTQGDAPKYILAIWSMFKREIISWIRNDVPVLYKTEFIHIDLIRADLISYGKGTLRFFEFIPTIRGHGLNLKPPVDVTKKVHLKSIKIVPYIRVIREKVIVVKEIFETADEEAEEEAQEEEEAEAEELEEIESEEELELEKKRRLAAEEEAKLRRERKAKLDARPKLAVKPTAEGDPDQLVDFRDDRILCGTSKGNLKIYQYEEMIGEITRSGDHPLHDKGPIVYIDYNPETKKVLTVGKDGFCRMWDYLEINTVVSKRIRETHKHEMQESFELKLVNESDLVIEPYFGFKCDENLYFIQDTNLDLYQAELRIDASEEKVKNVFRTHSGPVTDMIPAPYLNYLAVITETGHLLIYNPIRKSVIAKKVFKVACTSVFWFPLEVDKTGCVLVVGFIDGTIRVVIVSVPFKEKIKPKKECASVTQAFKPHSDRITQIKLSYTNEILASASYDETIVLYEAIPHCQYLKLLAINAIKTNGPVNYISWKKSLNETTLLVTCSNGFFGDYKIPMNLKHFRTKTLPYYLKLQKRISMFRCLYYEQKYSADIMDEVVRKKFELRENLEYADSGAGLSFFDEPNRPKIIHKSLKREEYPKTNKNLFHKTEISCPDLAVLPYKVPVDRPANILFARYITDDKVWVSPDDPEGGYIYEYVLGKDEPSHCYPITDLENTAITSHLYILNDEYLVIGLKTGKIRLIKTNKMLWFDFSDYLEIAVHDPNNGHITGLNTSIDLTMLFSSGADGNVIAYHLNIDPSKYLPTIELPDITRPPEEIDDFIPKDTPRIQEGRIENVPNPVRDDILESVADKMENIRDRYEELLKLNETLPAEYRFNKEYFTLAALENEKMFFLKNKAKRIQKKYHYEFFKLKRFLHNMKSYFNQDMQTHLVHLINTKNKNIAVTTYRTFKFDDYFYKIEKEASDAIELENKMFKVFASVEGGESSKIQEHVLAQKDDDEFELYLLNNKQFIEQFGPEKRDYFFRLYADRSKMRDLIRQLEELYKIPQQRYIESFDKVFEERFREQIRKVKQETAHKSSASKERITYCLIKCLRYMYQLKEDFNKKVLAVRDLKLEAVYDYRVAKRDASYISKEMKLPFDFEIPSEPPFDRLLEFPESYTEGHSAKFIPEGPAPPVPEEWVQEYIFIYGNRDPVEFTGDFDDDSFDEMVDYLLTKGMNLKQISSRVKRFSRFKSRLREIVNISTKLSTYDSQIENLIYEKFVIDQKITQINFIASSLYQELFIVRFYAVLEEKITEVMTPLIKKRCILQFKITLEERALKRIKAKRLNALHNYAAMEKEALETIAKSGKYARKLRSLFYKICKKKKLIELNEDDDNDDDDDTLTDYTLESVIKGDDSEGSEISSCPDDLKQEIYDLVIHLAKRRIEEEAEANRCKILEDERRKNVEPFIRNKICCETVLAFNHFRLSKLKDDKNKQIGKLNVTFIMKPSELQCFDPETNKLIDNPTFTTAESLKKHEADNITMKQDEEFTKEELRKLFGQMKKILADIRQLGAKKEKVNKELKERMILRFGREVNMQETIEFAIKGLIHSQKDKTRFKNKELKADMKVLSNKLYDKTSELLEATRENTNKMHIKCALLEERNKTMESLLKKKKKPLFDLDALAENIKKLREEIRKEEERKRYLIKKIIQMKTKGAMGLSEEEEEEFEAALKPEKMEVDKSKESETIKSDVSKGHIPTPVSEEFTVELKEYEETSVSKLQETGLDLSEEEEERFEDVVGEYGKSEKELDDEYAKDEEYLEVESGSDIPHEKDYEGLEGEDFNVDKGFKEPVEEDFGGVEDEYVKTETGSAVDEEEESDD